MAPVNLTITVRGPLWLRAVLRLAQFAYHARYWVADIAPTDAEIDRLINWYGRHLKVEAR